MPSLGRGDVHVWSADLDQWRGHLDQCASVLTADEQQRSESFRQPLHRERAQVTRGILRLLLSQYLAVTPQGIAFAQGEHGKPCLPAPAPLHFNLSHSAQCAVFAFTRLGDIGVDIECVRDDMPRQREIAEKYFAPGELAQLDAFPEAERNAAFFRCWTRKEAYVKARGDGIFAGLQTFEVSLAMNDARLLRVENMPDAQMRWWMAALPALTDCIGAVVAASPAGELSCWSASPILLLGSQGHRKT